MQEIAPSQNASPYGERRRHLRQKPSSLIYVEIDASNGGILLNLGPGGLAFQPACKISGKQDVTVKLRLGENGESAEIVGGIAWQAPEQGETGLCFKSLSSHTQQQIADWIARQSSPEAARALPVTVKRSVPTPELPSAAIASDATVKTAEIPHVAPAEQVPRRQWVLPEALTPSRAATPSPLPHSLEATLRQVRDRRWSPLMMTGLAVCSLVLVLILTVAYLAPSHPGVPAQNTPAVPTAPGAPGTAAPSSPPVQAAAQEAHPSQWVALVKAVFPGLIQETKPAATPVQAAVRVWVSRSNGFYYCSDSPDFQTTQPGSLITQGEALQSGYQPKLGGFCN
jgi:hypothetical protein